MIKKILKWTVLVLILAFIAIQFVPVTRDNPDVLNALEAPEDVDGILRRACYDCHSNETKWPWYSYIAPISWEVEEHVAEGRKTLNFSSWNPRSAKKNKKEMKEEIENGEMPLSEYLLLHPEAELSEDDRRILFAWFDQDS